MGISKLVLGAMLLAAAAPPASQAIELQQSTREAWDAYVRAADLRMQNRMAGNGPFLWADQSEDRLARLRRGEVLVEPVAGRGTQSVPQGLIHDWIGAVFIPDATIESLWAVVHDYDNYRRIYKPAVAGSRVLACDRATQEFSMVLQRKILFVNAAIQGRFHAEDVTVNGQRGYNIAESTEIREIESYGHARERLLPPDTGDGFLWRLHSIARYEQRDGGLYLELEAIALTREVPASLGWLVNPAINRISVNSLTTTLRQTRAAVIALHGATVTAAACPNRGTISADSRPEARNHSHAEHADRN